MVLREDKGVIMEYEFDVFLSHRHLEADRKLVLQLKNDLTKVGLKVWLDEEQIPPGGNIPELLAKGIQASKVIVVVVSPESLASGWVQEEYSLAVMIGIQSKAHTIIPALLRTAELPGFITTRQWVDFRDDSNYQNSLRQLIWGIKGEWLTSDNLPPEGKALTLEEILLQAEKSLIISGHTLDKFAQNQKVKIALGTLLGRNVHVKVILLNPYCNYSKAHEPFHNLESLSSGHVQMSAHAQIMSSINAFRRVFENNNETPYLEVLLTNYMPRFRTIIIDQKVCYVSLYMYGRDVEATPEFKFDADGINSSSFRIIEESTHQIIRSVDVIPLIQHGRYNDDWENSKIADMLNDGVATDWFRHFGQNQWKTIRSIILGYQNDRPLLASQLGICDRWYEAGTFTLDCIGPTSPYLESQTMFSEWLDEVLKTELSIIQEAHPELFRRESRYSLFQKVKTALNSAPGDIQPLICEIWYQEYPDIIRRLLMTFLTSNPDLALDVDPTLTTEKRGLVIEVLDWLERTKQPDLKDWLHLSVSAELLGINDKPNYATSSDIIESRAIDVSKADETAEFVVQRVGEQLWEAAKSPCRIDATSMFLQILKIHSRPKLEIISFPGDYLATIVLLKFYEKLLDHFSALEIDLVPRSIQCSNEATYDNVRDLLESSFPGLEKAHRFRLIANGPKVGGVNLIKLHPDVMKLLEQPYAVLDVRGAKAYEMMQGVNKEAFFGFTVYQDISESVTGLPAEENPFVFLHQGPGEHSFEGFKFRHMRRENGKMLAKRTAKDWKVKWEGGHLAGFEEWPTERRMRFQILHDFYGDRSQFEIEIGRHLEVEVKDFLDRLSGRILVIGCGTGREVHYLADRHNNVYGFDFSWEAILWAQESYPDLKDHFFVEDWYNLDTIMTGEFDSIVANAALVHLLDRDDLAPILGKIRERMKQDGLCFIRMLSKGESKEEYDQLRNNRLRWFVYYSSAELRKIAQEVGFTVERLESYPHAQFRGVTWISLLLRKPSSNTEASHDE